MKKYILSSILILSFLAASCLKEDDGPVAVTPVGSVLAPEVGGAAQPNQVWVDLGSATMKSTPRPAWDLGFYSGAEFRVILNNSTLMAAAPVDVTDIDQVNQSHFTQLMSILEIPAGFSEQYIDDPAGNYLNNGTVINEVSANDAENKVYLVKLGYDTYTGNDIPANTTYTIGNSRGFIKVRILRNDNNSYKIQYAELNSTTHFEYIVEKNPDYHFSFFSFKTDGLADVQPEKKNWDICFTVWNNVIEDYGTYTYADFIISNTLSGVGVYQVNSTAQNLDLDFNNFTAENVDENLFVTNDQRALGSSWRTTVSGTSSDPVVYGDRFYVIKDADGYLFKLRFISMLGPDNERGHPQFEYEPL